MRLALLTTHQVGRRAIAQLERLEASVEAMRKRSGAVIEFHCLLQQACAAKSETSTRGNGGNHYHNGAFMPLSRARNELLRRIEPNTFDFVLFPDDDCFYQEQIVDLLAHIRDRLGADLAIVGNADPPDSIRIDDIRACRPELSDILRRTSSNNLVVSGRLAARIGPFDEHLGLGTAMGGAEDTDYAVRALRLAARPILIRDRYVGHRPFASTLSERMRDMPRYWPGTVAVTLRILTPRLLPLLVYRLAAGVLLLLLGRLSLARFAAPFARVARGRNEQ